MKARNRKGPIHQHDLSPHLSTASSRKGGPKKSCTSNTDSNKGNPSSSSSPSLSFSFRSLSLKQATASSVTSSSPGRTTTVEDSTTNGTTTCTGPSPRPNPLSADFDIYSPQCPPPTTLSTTSESEVPKGMMIRKVSLEPRTQFTSSTSTSKTTDTTIGTYTDKNFTCYVQHKRSRHLSCPDSITCDGLMVRQTQKRRRLAKRNKALTSTDFDSILGSIDVGCISGA